jgi:hypothetical protein
VPLRQEGHAKRRDLADRLLSGNLVQGCEIGTDPTDEKAVANDDGILLTFGRSGRRGQRSGWRCSK